MRVRTNTPLLCFQGMLKGFVSQKSAGSSDTQPSLKPSRASSLLAFARASVMALRRLSSGGMPRCQARRQSKCYLVSPH